MHILIDRSAALDAKSPAKLPSQPDMRGGRSGSRPELVRRRSSAQSVRVEIPALSRRGSSSGFNLGGTMVVGEEFSLGGRGSISSNI